MNLSYIAICRSMDNGAIEKLKQQEEDLLKLFDENDCLKNDEESRMEMKDILTDIRKVALQAWHDKKRHVLQRVEKIIRIQKLQAINQKVLVSFQT